MKPRARAKKAQQREALPLEEQIRRRAHELYVERGNQSGSEMEDWLQAEQEIREAEEQRKKRT
ncbi:MAG: DUF2934 domain-containing protein [Acidobacteriia bacterium]|nr:DUF2934 domain-containing protein [Terriglobia bacterium]